MSFFENVFEVLFWVVVIFSPIVMVIGLHKLYNWLNGTNDEFYRKRAAAILADFERRQR